MYLLIWNKNASLSCSIKATVLPGRENIISNISGNSLLLFMLFQHFILTRLGQNLVSDWNSYGQCEMEDVVKNCCGAAVNNYFQWKVAKVYSKN